MILLTCTIFQGLAFLSKFKAAFGELPEEPSKLIKGALPVTYHKRTRSTHSVCIKLVVPWRHVCLLWIWGHIQWKKFVARQLSQISEAITYTLSHTHGEGVFSTGNGKSSCVLFFTGTTTKEKEKQVSSISITAREATQYTG